MDTLKRVDDQKIGEKTFEDFIAGLLEDLDGKTVDLAYAGAKIKAMQQLNNRHKNLLDVQRERRKSLSIK